QQPINQLPHSQRAPTPTPNTTPSDNKSTNSSILNAPQPHSLSPPAATTYQPTTPFSTRPTPPHHLFACAAPQKQELTVLSRRNGIQIFYYQ
ncbi:MAG: hypothetical protein LBQ31_05935, partial [Bacteroidales bacterium]|nr:hypothetical protein [Bacteroidales bacterium]